MMSWDNMSGFRQEIKPKSNLGKLLTKTADRIRRSSNARERNVVTKVVKPIAIDVDYGPFSGKFTIQPKSNSISFHGGNRGYAIEYVYGKLTIQHGNRYVPAREAVRVFTKFLKSFNQPYVFIESNFTKVGA